jgi:hypothetical protein
LRWKFLAEKILNPSQNRFDIIMEKVRDRELLKEFVKKQLKKSNWYKRLTTIDIILPGGK